LLNYAIFIILFFIKPTSTTMESTFGSRVREYRKFKGLSQTAFAEQCDLEQGNITQMEKGTEPKQSNVAKIISGYPDLSPDWLLLGTGPMLRDNRTLTPEPAYRKQLHDLAAQVAATSTPEAGTPARGNHGQVVEHADTVLLLSETEQRLIETEKELTGVKSENQQLNERLQDAKEEILWLRGKSTPSSYAAAPEVEPLKMRRWHEVVSQAPQTGGKQLFMDTTGPVSDELAA
jgi:transcriptional regulator with XRE-family HTH domain